MLHKLHRISAAIIGSYVLFHLINHLFALKGISAHVAFMDSYRKIYRFPVMEFVLLGCVLYQVGSGIYFVKKRRGQRHVVFAKFQALSGGYLAFFLLAHVSANLYGRGVLGLDTNFYYGAAGLNITPFHLFFIPYYFLAVVAFFTHVSCAFHLLSREHVSVGIRNRLATTLIIVGTLLSVIILSTFRGAFYEVEIPHEYRATFE